MYLFHWEPLIHYITALTENVIWLLRYFVGGDDHVPLRWVNPTFDYLFINFSDQIKMSTCLFLWFMTNYLNDQLIFCPKPETWSRCCFLCWIVNNNNKMYFYSTSHTTNAAQSAVWHFKLLYIYIEQVSQIRGWASFPWELQQKTITLQSSRLLQLLSWVSDF